MGDDEPLAKFRLKLPDYEEHKCELEIIERLVSLGLKPDIPELSRRFAVPIAKAKQDKTTSEDSSNSESQNNEI